MLRPIGLPVVNKLGCRAETARCSVSYWNAGNGNAGNLIAKVALHHKNNAMSSNALSLDGMMK